MSPPHELGPQQRFELLELARASVASGLQHGEFASCQRESTHPELNRPAACFVTLRIGEDLRGCCGTLEATRPLYLDVWNNAWASAFADPRFPPLTADEWRGTGIEISVLSPPEPCEVRNEAELLNVLRPGVDGLILQAGARRTTFLPAVWEQLPNPAQFVHHLKMKVGWPLDFWPPDMQVWRYTTESF